MHIQTLYTILKHYIRGKKLPYVAVKELNGGEWEDLYRSSVQQGVVAIVYGMISPLANDVAIPRSTKLKWALHAENIERGTQRQLRMANELADIYKSANIDTVVLKGLGLGEYYPISAQRECGDFDCYLFDNYQKGVDCAKANGATIGHVDYKHAQLSYKGLSVEVHKYFTSFRGEISKHQFEQTLNSLIRDYPCRHLYDESNILQANPTFNAIFLIYHTLFHFLFESVKLRHILDWGLMVKAEHEVIDWDLFNRICEKHKLLKFAEAVTAICNDYLGFALAIPINAHGEYRDKILSDIMSVTDGVSNKRGWSRRLQLVKNTFKSRWKYELIDTTFIADLAKRGFYFIFSNDKLKTS